MQRAAFTLVELSIVLVILGLLIGGVLSGQSLIRAAELRSIVTERDKYTTAMHSFQDKYGALPGDMPNAYAFWANRATGCSANAMTMFSGCNGNGNGTIDMSNGTWSAAYNLDQMPNGDTMLEAIKLWMHLSFAGLIEGTYDGAVASSGGFYGTNSLPASRFPGGYWLLQSGVASLTAPSLPAAPPGAPDWLAGGLYLSLGNYPDGNNPTLPGLTHGEAWNIDVKTDDGHANTGRTRSTVWGQCFDLNTDGNASNGDEDLYGITALGADARDDCAVIFVLR